MALIGQICAEQQRLAKQAQKTSYSTGIRQSGVLIVLCNANYRLFSSYLIAYSNHIFRSFKNRSNLKINKSWFLDKKKKTFGILCVFSVFLCVDKTDLLSTAEAMVIWWYVCHYCPLIRHCCILQVYKTTSNSKSTLISDQKKKQHLIYKIKKKGWKEKEWIMFGAGGRIGLIWLVIFGGSSFSRRTNKPSKIKIKKCYSFLSKLF